METRLFPGFTSFGLPAFPPSDRGNDNWLIKYEKGDGNEGHEEKVKPDEGALLAPDLR